MTAAAPPRGPGRPSMTFAESTSLITRIGNLQYRLLDHTGHVRRGMTRDDMRIDLNEIQRMRAAVGWKPLNMQGRYRR